ncbi:MAG TPA: antibiotic biosynthesis monooxygenase [Ktedonobacteraceae bacterium]|nr:antibiotic biosynthesis monooxygenase [Ktedonobacteraceae bacterium]
MYARVTTFELNPGKIDEALEVARTDLVPVMKQQPGFKAVLTLVDREAAKAISVSLWETEDDLKAGESSGYYQQQVSRLASFVMAAPNRETYEATLEQ